MIDQDAIGRLGEAKFYGLCAAAQLPCNRVQQDLAGWDFLVQFELDDASSQTLDHRKAPLSCYVQVKTVGLKVSSVKLKLNMAERLAKETLPSFICVFKVDDDLEIAEAYLIHVIDENLSKILKRLRLEEQKGTERTKLNKESIYFTPKDFDRINIAGTELRKRLEDASGKDVEKYIELKQTQLSKLGFDKSAFEIRTTFQASNYDELADIFLGLAPAVTVSNFQVSETRFGIKLSEPNADSAKIMLKPNPLDTCTIAIRRDDDVPAIFRGEIFITPPLLEGRGVCLVRSDLFSIRIGRDDKELSIGFTFHPPGDRRFSPLAWTDYFRMILAIREDQAAIEIRLDNRNAIIEGPVQVVNPIRRDELSDPRSVIELCTNFENIIKRAGVGQNEAFTFDEISDAGNDINFLSALLADTKPVLDFELSEELKSKLPSHPIIFSNRFVVGSCAFAYYAMVQVSSVESGGIMKLKIGDFVVKKIRLLSKDAESYKAFNENAQTTEGTEFMVFARPQNSGKIAE